MTQTPPELLEGEVLLPAPDPQENILRGVHPRWLKGDRLSFEAFMLNSREKELGAEKLSAARETLQTPAGLHAERNAVRQGCCVAVAAASVETITSTHESLRVIDDSLLVTTATGHAYIDMRTVEPADRALRAQELAVAFNSSGALHAFGEAEPA